MSSKMLALFRGSDRLLVADLSVPYKFVSLTELRVYPAIIHTWFFAQTAKARSMSGDRPFARLMGDRLPSSCMRYFSFCRKTLDTVLCAC